MSSSCIDIRVATLHDSTQLFDWRNHPSVRSVSHNPEAINWADHQQWLTEVLTSSNRFLLIGQHQNTAVGVVRFDIKENEAEISIYLVPGVHESGFGQDLLMSAEYWLIDNHPEIRKLRADVLSSNERSYRFFKSAGFEVTYTSFSKKMFKS
jgi:RimJ/RimL family protein N-acetyltransferase